MSRGMHLGNVIMTSVSSPIQACFDGKYVWVTGSGNTKVFEVWANSTDDMGISPTKEVKLVYELTTSDLAPNTAIPSENTNIADCSFITYGNEYMWIALKKQWTNLFKDIPFDKRPKVERSKMLFDCILKVHRRTKQIVEVIRTPIAQSHKDGLDGKNLSSYYDNDIPYSHYYNDGSLGHQYTMMNSVLHFAQGKLWMVEDYVEANGSSQKIWIYDTATSTWTSQTFNGKIQKSRAQITSTNGYVYLSAYNSLSVLKHDAGTGAFITSIKGNANPNALCGLPDGRVLVSSLNGLISHLNVDNTWSHDLMVETDECTQIAYESNDVCWAVDGANHLFKVQSDNYVYGTKYTGEDYLILTANDMNYDDELATRTDITTSPLWDFDKLALQGDLIDLQYNSLNGYSFNYSIDYALVIQPIKYQKWNGTQMVDVEQPALLVLLTSSEVVVINTSEIKFGFPRPEIKRSTMSAVGVGMISFGPNDYLGD